MVGNAQFYKFYIFQSKCYVYTFVHLFSGGLHMTPVHTTLQLRPGLKYLDKIDEKLKNASKKAQAMEEEELVSDLKGVKLNQEDPGIGSSKGKGTGRGRPPQVTFVYICPFLYPCHPNSFFIQGFCR
jgi:hypothetical protein